MTYLSTSQSLSNQAERTQGFGSQAKSFSLFDGEKQRPQEETPGHDVISEPERSLHTTAPLWLIWELSVTSLRCQI